MGAGLGLRLRLGLLTPAQWLLGDFKIKVPVAFKITCIHYKYHFLTFFLLTFTRGANNCGITLF